MNSSQWPLMTSAEIHAFGIEAILPYLAKEDFAVQAVNADPVRQPQVVGQRWGRLAFVYVRTAMYPEKGSLSSTELEHALAWAARAGATPFFASVGLACCALPDKSEVQSDAEMRLPIKNGGFHVAYSGLLVISSGDRVHVWPEPLK